MADAGHLTISSGQLIFVGAVPIPNPYRPIGAIHVVIA